MNAIEIKEKVYWVGIRDWERRVFDSLIPLPLGTTYNSYLIEGEDKTALIDTVEPRFVDSLLGNIKEVHPGGIDYLIMNHAEPDHAGSIPRVMAAYPSAVLVCTQKGAEQAKLYFKVSDGRIKVVKDNDTIDLGGRTLRFVDAPFLHWPETMFTYLVEDRVLFPCDFMGFHVANATWDDESDEFMTQAQAYFGEIMMPFKKMGAKALDKIKDFPIDIIAPSHGPFHRHPERILKAYRAWTVGETREKVLVAYVSMHHSTAKLARTMAEDLIGRGVLTTVHDLAQPDLGFVARDHVDSRALVFAAPTVMGNLHPMAVLPAYLVKALRPPLKLAVFLSSHGWSGGAAKHAVSLLDGTGIELFAAHDVKGPPTDSDLAAVRETARKLAEKVKL